MTKEKIYYRESRWIYLVFLVLYSYLIYLKDYVFITIMLGLTFLVVIIQNETKPKKVRTTSTERTSKEKK